MLSPVSGIVKQRGGSTWLYSEAGTGTIFKIYLPQTEGADGEIPIHQGRASVSGGREMILLLEEEPSFRELICEWLTEIGYRVLALPLAIFRR